jgi:hypothetical protein
MRSSPTSACSRKLPSLSSASRRLRSLVDMLADWTCVHVCVCVLVCAHVVLTRCCVGGRAVWRRVRVAATLPRSKRPCAGTQMPPTAHAPTRNTHADPARRHTHTHTHTCSVRISSLTEDRSAWNRPSCSSMWPRMASHAWICARVRVCAPAWGVHEGGSCATGRRVGRCVMWPARPRTHGCTAARTRTHPAHLRVQAHEVVRLCDVVLDGLQLQGPQRALNASAVLRQHTALGVVCVLCVCVCVLCVCVCCVCVCVFGGGQAGSGWRKNVVRVVTCWRQSMRGASQVARAGAPVAARTTSRQQHTHTHTQTDREPGSHTCAHAHHTQHAAAPGPGWS